MRHVSLVVRLQWTILKNSLRTPHGILDFLLRVLMSISLAVFALVVGVAVAVALAVIPPSPYDVAILSLCLGGATAYWQLFPLLMASSGLGVDVGRLRHFPVAPGTLFAFDLSAGALDPVAVTVYPALIGLVVGVAIRSPVSLPAAAVGALAFAAFNLALSRFALRLLERFLANRRRKEIFVVALFLLAFAPQAWLVLSKSEERTSRPAAQVEGDIGERFSGAASYLSWTPPGLAAMAAAGEGADPIVGIVGGVALAGAMMAVAYRQLHAPFRGRRARSVLRPWPSTARRRSRVGTASDTGQRTKDEGRRTTNALDWLSPAKAVVVRKELRYTYRSPRVLVVYIGALFGTAFFALFLGTLPSKAVLSEHTLPGLCFFSLWQISFLFVNTFCFDAHGVKLYYMSPIRGTDVFAAKNLVAAIPVVLQTAIIATGFHFVVMPVSASVLVVTALVVSVSLLLLLAAGNLLSCLFPHPIDPRKLSGSTASGIQVVAGMVAVGIVFALVAAGAFAGRLTGVDAITFVVLGAELVAAVALYVVALSGAGALFERRAERIVDALTRVG